MHTQEHKNLAKSHFGWSRFLCSISGLFLGFICLSGAEMPLEHPSREAGSALKGMAVAPDLKARVFASEPFVQNPVAFDFDERGRCFLVETHRRRTSVFDIRHVRDWLEDDFSFRTVEDRRQFLQRFVTPNSPIIRDEYQIDRNNDGIYDARDLAVESERIRRLVDTDGDGVVDQATVFAEGFDSVVSGVAAGILARGDSVWFNCIPDLWRLKDRDGDGVADEREVLHTGFGVHIAFGGHDFHGAIMGPDGLLYTSIADRGSHIEKDGTVLASLPDTGAIFRCRPDGSEFEVVATGLRNPQELAFDDFGNLWTVDNNGDGGDQARLIHVVEGGNSGWHMGWQWQPDMGPWKAEKLWQVAGENTASYLLPPLAYVGHGPAGFAYYPGTGLPARFANHFFIADFPGGVRAFTVDRSGASFQVVHSREYLQNNSPENMAGKVIWGLSPVDVGFAPGGGLYVADWIQGWTKTGKGRIFQLYSEEIQESAAVKEVQRILADGLEETSVRELGDLLGHADQRVRQRAQFELARRYQPSRMAVTEVITGALGLNSLSMFKRVLTSEENLVARLHAIWGVGQIIEKHREASRVLLPFLEDKNPEIRAQVAKVFGDRGVVEFYSNYSNLLNDPDPRVRFAGAMWLGKTVRRGYHEVESEDGSKQLVSLRNAKPIFDLLRNNADQDLYLRHAAVMALTYINDLPGLVGAVDDASRSVRLGAVLALRRLRRPEIAEFLDDEDRAIVLEAARAIYDENLEAALPQLAALSRQPELGDAILRRSLNALLRLGKTENAAFLVAFAEDRKASEAMRVEALNALSVWGDPPKRDRMIGLWRPMGERDQRSAVVPLRLALPNLFTDPSEAVREATIRAMSRLGISTETERLLNLVSNVSVGKVLQLAALDALAEQGGESLLAVVRKARNSAIDEVRQRASTWQSRLPVEEALQLYRRDLAESEVALQQAALVGLAEIDDPRAGRLIETWFDLLLAGNVAEALVLDLLEAAAMSPYEPLANKLKTFESRRQEDDRLSGFREVLVGGSIGLGRRLFEERQDLGCVRCHKADGDGGDVGPNLAGVADRLAPEKILESILYPNAEITSGFESVTVELKEGGYYSGVLKAETEESIVLNSLEDGELTVSKADIANRTVGLSAMPEQIDQLISKRDLRDLLAFLTSLKAP